MRFLPAVNDPNIYVSAFVQNECHIRAYLIKNFIPHLTFAAMELHESEFDRLLLFQQTRKAAEARYAEDPQDAENLAKWGGALLELAHFQGIEESKVLMNDAISKLEEALAIKPSMDDALWCLGNAFTSYGYLTPDVNEARPYFDRATDCYLKAVNLDPNNLLYRRSLEISDQTPALHIEMHKSEVGQKMMQQSKSSNQKRSRSKKSNDFVYDIFGWIILAIGIVAWIGRAKPNVIPAPP